MRDRHDGIAQGLRQQLMHDARLPSGLVARLQAQSSANLQHPHILPLFDSGSADGQLF